VYDSFVSNKALVVTIVGCYQLPNWLGLSLTTNSYWVYTTYYCANNRYHFSTI